MIPEQFENIYPNPVQDVEGTPAVVFRDHRWTLPVLRFAADKGLLRIPARVATFDRHRDSLTPLGDFHDLARFRSGKTVAELVEAVSERLSPRDDDWIAAGMEMGLISDVVQFRTEPDGMTGITRYIDGAGTGHRIFHLERPSTELSWKGALVEEDHPLAGEGLWRAFGWNPGEMTVAKADDLAVDIDLDFFTISWETYVIPFPEEVYTGEFFTGRQSGRHHGYPPIDFFRSLTRAARVLTIACEPDFCGGEAKTRQILTDVNRFLLGGAMNRETIRVEYPPEYPVE
jgi:hypothetical protein